MRLIIRGDKTIASKYLGYAKNKLRNIKYVMAMLGIKYDRKYYRLLNAELMIESRYGADTIWIKAGKKVEKCKLKAILTPIGGNQVHFQYEYIFDDDPINQVITVDTGGRFLGGGTRYLLHTPSTSTNVFFPATGDYTIVSVAQASDNFVSHDSGVIAAPTYSVDMDVSSIAPKATLLMTRLGSESIAVDAFANGVYLGTFNDATHRVRIFSATVTVEDTMVMSFVALTGNVQRIQIGFRQYDCLATHTQTITVT